MTTLRAALVATLMTAVAAATGSIGAPALAQTVKKGESAKAAPAATPKRDVGELQKLVDSGIASIDAGKLDQGIQQISAALSAGGLPPQLMARALFYRGAAYRKQSKPAQAIADLTSSLWLKGGLTDSERKQAIEERQAAYRDAGLPDQAVQVASTKASGDGAAKADSPASAPSTGSFLSGLFNSSAEPAAAPKVETASVPAAAKAPPSQNWQTATNVKQAAVTVPAAAPAAVPPAAKAPAPPAKGWATDTVSTGGTKVASAAAAGGGLRVQIANVKTKVEAASIADRLQSENAADMTGRQVEVIETKAGSMGTIYRVKIGPFAEATQSQAFCAKVRNMGLDCMVVRD
ncbi:MAG: SPOR domain-containing protein [Hyphomicrobiaceae bacterium]